MPCCFKYHCQEKVSRILEQTTYMPRIMWSELGQNFNSWFSTSTDKLNTQTQPLCGIKAWGGEPETQKDLEVILNSLWKLLR